MIFDDDDKQIHLLKYGNGSFLAYEKFVFLNSNIFYNFEKDTKSLRIKIEFKYPSKFFPLGVDKIWYIPKNSDRCILKYYRGLI